MASSIPVPTVPTHTYSMLVASFFALVAFVLAVTAAPLSKRAQFTGRATFYDAGDSIGNCGWQNSADQYVVALNVAQYGSTDQVSQFCGQVVTITYQAITLQAEIVDSCPTCPYAALDMSTSLFSALTNGDLDMGTMTIDWSFNSNSTDEDSTGFATYAPLPTTYDMSILAASATAAVLPTSAALFTTAAFATTPALAATEELTTPTSTAMATVASPTTAALDTTITIPLLTALPELTAFPTLAASPTSSTPSPTTFTPYPTTTPVQLQTGVPQRTDEVGNAACPDIELPAGFDAVSVAPSPNAGVDLLPSTCGKWVWIHNPANNRSTVTMLTNYNVTGSRGEVWLSDAYMNIATITNGTTPQLIQNVTWGFLN